MNSNKKKGLTAASLIVLLLIIDQAIKLAVKLNMTLGESIHIFDWFQIEFVENNGMAWGMELGSKLFLSLFRIFAVVGLIWYVRGRIKKGARMAYIVVLSMICAGAPMLMGKVVDMFYFPLFTGTFPDWMPLCGGQSFVFFSPVFNFADACISVGVITILLFFRKDFNGWIPEKR